MPLTSWPRPCTVCLKPLRMYGKKTCGASACIREWRQGTANINFMRMQYAEMTIAERFNYDTRQHDEPTQPDLQLTQAEIDSENAEIDRTIRERSKNTSDMPASLRDLLSPENAPIKKEETE